MICLAVPRHVMIQQPNTVSDYLGRRGRDPALDQLFVLGRGLGANCVM